VSICASSWNSFAWNSECSVSRRSSRSQLRLLILEIPQIRLQIRGPRQVHVARVLDPLALRIRVVELDRTRVVRDPHDRARIRLLGHPRLGQLRVHVVEIVVRERHDLVRHLELTLELRHLGLHLREIRSDLGDLLRILRLELLDLAPQNHGVVDVLVDHLGDVPTRLIEHRVNPIRPSHGDQHTARKRGNDDATNDCLAHCCHRKAS